MRRLLLPLILITAAGPGCTGNELLSSPSESLVGSEWRLVAFDTSADGLIRVPASEMHTAAFSSESAFHAEVDC